MLGLLSILVCFFAKNKNILILFVILLAIKDFDKKEIVTKVYYISFISYSIIVILSLLNILPDWIFYRESKVRHGLGFCYATDAMSIYLHIVLMYSYVRYNDYSFLEIILFEIVNILLFYFTDARMSFLLITLINLIMIFMKIFNEKIFESIITKKIIKIIAISLPIFLFMLYNLAVIGYNEGNHLFMKTDKLISGRLRLTRQAYLENDITIFGQKIEWYRLGRIWLC